MPAIGRERVVKANIMPISERPILPVPMWIGSISWNLSLEGKPTANLEYRGILEEDLPNFQKTYGEYVLGLNQGKDIIINGYPFVVETYTYQADRSDIRNVGRLYTYEVQVQLQWKWTRACEATVFPLKKGTTRLLTIAKLCEFAKIPYKGPEIKIKVPEDVQAKDYSLNVDNVLQEWARTKQCFIKYGRNGIELASVDAGERWNFPTEDILTDGGNTLARLPQYRDASLSFGDNDNDNEPDDQDEPRYRYRQEQVKRLELFEFDDDFASPPAHTKVVRDFENNWDVSGPTKTWRRRVVENGNPIEEEVRVYGFTYHGDEIDAPNGQIKLVDPDSFWDVVEYQKTTYVYEQQPSVSVGVTGFDPKPGTPPGGGTTSNSKQVSLFVHPSYQNVPNVTAGVGGVSIRPSARMLTEVITTGWTKKRFVPETEDGGDGYWSSLDPDDPFNPIVRFRKIPKVSGQAFKLKPMRRIYGDEGIGTPFSVEWADVSGLSRREKTRLGLGSFEDKAPEDLLRFAKASSVMTNDGRIGYIVPDPNYVEPYAVETETTFSSSFAYTKNPNYDEGDWANPYPEPPGHQFARMHLIIGDETYSRIDRVNLKTVQTIRTGEDIYQEKTTEYSATGTNFGDYAATIRFTDVAGRLPEATIYQLSWEQLPDQSVRVYRLRSGSVDPGEYLVTTENADEYDEGGSFSYPNAKTLEQAKGALVADLRVQGWQQCQEQKVVTWFVPVDIGDYVVTENDKYEEYASWRAVAVSQSLEYSGAFKEMPGVPLVTGQGTQITLGFDKSRTINVSQRGKDRGNSGDLGGTASEPFTVSTGSSGPIMGKILPALETRRNFKPNK